MRVKTIRLSLVLLAGASLAACATPRYATRMDGTPIAQGKPARQMPGRGGTGEPYQVGGIWYVPREQPNYDEVGVASWYGEAFNLKPTANGETFDLAGLTAAHTTLPLPSLVEVTNLENGRKLTVRVNDRGPFYGGRIIDLSQAAARELGYEQKGTARVRVRYLGPAPLLGPDAGVRYARAGASSLPTRLAATPTAPAPARPTQLAVEVASNLPPRAVPVESQALPPIQDQPTAPLAFPATRISTAAASPGLRIQAGCFASEANAEQAVSRLGAAGQAVIEPIQREGSTLYRVMLPAPDDEPQAYALRDRVAELGFADARVVSAR